MCVASIKIKNQEVYICSLYLDILKEVHIPAFLRLVEWCNRERMPLVIGMDSNAHSPLWGSDERNARGEELEETFLAKNLTVMNVGNEPTFETSRAKSCIDITVVNNMVLQSLNLMDWEVSTEASFSDHKYVTFSLGKYIPVEEKYRNLRKADWNLFQNMLDANSLPHVEHDGSNLDNAAEVLAEKIDTALESACPLKLALHRNPNPWWNSDLDQIREELRTLNNKRKNSDEDEHAYRELRKLYNKRIRREKRESWQKFCSKAETVKETAKIMKILRPKPKKAMGLFKNQDGSLSPKETLENLMDTHFLESVNADEEVVTAVPMMVEDEESNNVINYIDEQKVTAALASFGPYKAPGPDGFKPMVLQKLTEEFISYITKIYKTAVRTRVAPKVWREMKVVFIPKEGKTDYGTAKSYRPITLSNFLLKGLERLVQWFLNEHIIQEPLYAQHAYTVGRSCDTAVSEVVDFIEKNTYRSQHVLAVSLDCTGAFDRIKFESADVAMEAMQIPKSIRGLYKNILEGRTVTADLQGESIKRIPKRGSPQGGVLSPLIWILIMQTILTEFHGTAVKVVGYADDIILLIAGKHPPTLVDLMNRALKKVTKWGDKNGLVFNPSKTQAVRFSQCRRFSSWKELQIYGTGVEYHDQMKYLGVILHRFLLWRPHCRERIKKATKTINLANAVIGQKWGFSPQKALWVYTAMARSVSTYGSLMWANSITGMIKNDLAKLQRKAMLNLTSSMRSTPTTGMEVVLGLLPLDLYAAEAATQARQRTRAHLTDGWDGIGNAKLGHRRKADSILNKIPTANLPSDQLTTRRVWTTHDEVEEPDITLYTDGSRMEDKSGAGWAACHGDSVIAEESVYLGKTATVFQAEVIAIERSLMWANENLDPNTKVTIRSDSQSAIQAILTEKTTSIVVLSCKKMLKTAQENLRIALRWIKGHADFTGNELADHLARLGSCMKVQTVAPEVPVPASTVKQEIKDHFRAEWQRRWNDDDSCRQTKSFIPYVNRKKTKKLVRKSRRELNLITQVCTGHALVAHHVGKWVEGVEDECEMCLEAEETTAHLFFECPALWRMREEMKSLKVDIEQQIMLFFSTDILVQLFEKRARSCASRLLQLI